jgi:hypothetical protein
MSEKEWQEFIQNAIKEILTRLANLECQLHDHELKCERNERSK